MKTKSLYFLIALIVLLSLSCNKSEDYDMASEPESEMNFLMSSPEKSRAKDQTNSSTPPETDEISITDSDETINIEKKIIKTASINFGVSDYKKSRANIGDIISKHKGFIASENEYNSSYSISNTIIIRVPAENFSKLLADLEGEADEFESKSINTSDVTEEYIDILKRLENKKKVEAQYIELLKKAHTIREILEVNEHIRVLREEIEAKEGRLRYLKNQVGLSTITLNIHEDYSTVSYGFFHKIDDALHGGWEGLLGLIIGLIYLWPLLIIAALVFILVRRRVKKRRKKE